MKKTFKDFESQLDTLRSSIVDEMNWLVKHISEPIEFEEDAIFINNPMGSENITSIQNTPTGAVVLGDFDREIPFDELLIGDMVNVYEQTYFLILANENSGI